MGTILLAPVFELIAGQPAVDLVNTLDWRFRASGTEELLGSYGDLLRFTVQAGLLDARQARRLLRVTDATAASRILKACVELREAFAAVLYEAVGQRTPAPEPLQTMERWIHAASAHRRLVWLDNRLQWQWPERQSPPELPLWQLSMSAAELIHSDSIQRVRQCGNAECRWLFLDTSKNHTRRWCNMKICGNRMKARRFKAQRRA